MKIEFSNKQLYEKAVLFAQNTDITVEELVEQALTNYFEYIKLQERGSIRYRKLNPENKIHKIAKALPSEMYSEVSIFEDIDDSAEHVSTLRKC